MASKPKLSIENVKMLYDHLTCQLNPVCLSEIPSIGSFSNILFQVSFLRPDIVQGIPIRQFLKERKTCDGKMEEQEGTCDTVDFDTSEVQEAVQRLNDCLGPQNLEAWKALLDRKDISETQHLVAVGVHIVKKLTGEAYTKLERTTTKCPCGCNGSLSATDMCIGTEDMWHGELDLLSGKKATNIVINHSVEKQQEQEETLEESGEGDLPDNRTNVEMVYKGLGLCHIVAQAIVFGFTEYNRHPDKSSYIPSLLVADKKFAACVYNPVTDELLISKAFINLCPDDQKISVVTFFPLWLFLNHQLFFRKKVNDSKYSASGFQKLIPPGKLPFYKELKDYKTNVDPLIVTNEAYIQPSGELIDIWVYERLIRNT